jgi:hypothetical protein
MRFMRHHFFGRRRPVEKTAEYAHKEAKGDDSHLEDSDSIADMIADMEHTPVKFRPCGATKDQWFKVVVERWTLDGKALVELLGKGVAAFYGSRDHPMSPVSRVLMSRLVSYGEGLRMLGFVAPPCLDHSHYDAIFAGFDPAKPKKPTKAMIATGMRYRPHPAVPVRKCVHGCAHQRWRGLFGIFVRSEYPPTTAVTNTPPLLLLLLLPHHHHHYHQQQHIDYTNIPSSQVASPYTYRISTTSVIQIAVARGRKKECMEVFGRKKYKCPINVQVDEKGRVRLAGKVKMGDCCAALEAGVFEEPHMWGEKNEAHRRLIVPLVRLAKECTEIVTTTDDALFMRRWHLLPMKARILRSILVILTDMKGDKWTLRGLSDWTQHAVARAAELGKAYGKGTEETVEKRHAHTKANQLKTCQCGGTQGTAANQCAYCIDHSAIAENDFRFFPDQCPALDSKAQAKQRTRLHCLLCKANEQRYPTSASANIEEAAGGEEGGREGEGMGAGQEGGEEEEVVYLGDSNADGAQAGNGTDDDDSSEESGAEGEIDIADDNIVVHGAVDAAAERAAADEEEVDAFLRGGGKKKYAFKVRRVVLAKGGKELEEFPPEAPEGHISEEAVITATFYRSKGWHEVRVNYKQEGLRQGATTSAQKQESRYNTSTAYLYGEIQALYYSPALRRITIVLYIRPKHHYSSSKKCDDGVDTATPFRHSQVGERANVVHLDLAASEDFAGSFNGDIWGFQPVLFSRMHYSPDVLADIPEKYMYPSVAKQLYFKKQKTDNAAAQPRAATADDDDDSHITELNNEGENSERGSGADEVGARRRVEWTGREKLLQVPASLPDHFQEKEHALLLELAAAAGWAIQKDDIPPHVVAEVHALLDLDAGFELGTATISVTCATCREICVIWFAGSLHVIPGDFIPNSYDKSKPLPQEQFPTHNWCGGFDLGTWQVWIEEAATRKELAAGKKRSLEEEPAAEAVVTAGSQATAKHFKRDGPVVTMDDVNAVKKDGSYTLEDGDGHAYAMSGLLTLQRMATAVAESHPRDFSRRMGPLYSVSFEELKKHLITELGEIAAEAAEEANAKAPSTAEVRVGSSGGENGTGSSRQPPDLSIVSFPLLYKALVQAQKSNHEVGGDIRGTTIDSLRSYAIVWLEHRRGQAGGAELVAGWGNIGGEALSLIDGQAPQMDSMDQLD